MVRTLTPKQHRFVQEYLVDLNATQAALRAGYSPKTARIIAAENLSKPNMQLAIQTAQEARATRTEITADRVLRELAVLGFSDVRHYALDAHYQLTLTEGSPAEVMRAVASVKHRVREHYGVGGDLVGIDHDVEHRLWDKNTALTNLAKHLGLLAKRVAHSGSMELNLSSRLAEARARALAARHNGHHRSP